jgi:S-formylglutathione hydrolase
MELETLSTNLAFGGVQGVYRPASAATGTPMTFSVFVPDHPGQSCRYCGIYRD